MPVDQTAVKRLKEERLGIWNQMQEIMQRATSESRAMTAEELQRWNALETDFSAKKEEIDVRERAAKIDDFMGQPAPTPAARAVDADPEGRQRADEYEKAFRGYLRRGMVGVSVEQRDLLSNNHIEFRDMGEASGAAGGYLVPPGFLAKITEILKFFGGMRQVANHIDTTSGQSLVWPVNDDTGNPAVIIGENTQVSELDLAFTQNSLNAWMYTTGAVRIGRALMQDSAFDLEAVVTNRFGKRFGRGQNTHFTNGTGTGQPQGVRNVAAATGVTTFDYTGLVGLKYAVDVAYRQNAVYMMSDAAVKSALLLTDTAGRPLFVPAGSFGSLASERPDTLLGSPIVVNNDLDAPGAGHVPALFGDFNAGYIIRDVVGSNAVLRLEERYADFAEIGFIGYARADGRIDDPNAIKRLQQ